MTWQCQVTDNKVWIVCNKIRSKQCLFNEHLNRWTLWLFVRNNCYFKLSSRGSLHRKLLLKREREGERVFTAKKILSEIKVRSAIGSRCNVTQSPAHMAHLAIHTSIKFIHFICSSNNFEGSSVAFLWQKLLFQNTHTHTVLTQKFWGRQLSQFANMKLS